MDENLVGYLLNALDDHSRREVDRQLRQSPEAQHRLSLLQDMMEPLAADRDEEAPPPGLWVRTLARVAEYRCRPKAPTLALPIPRPSGPGRTWWRRADVLVAASLLFCVSLLLPPLLSQIRYYHSRIACENNLRQFYFALRNFSDRHDGDFPNIAAATPEPWNNAGFFVPILNQEGLLGNEVSVQCPANGRVPPTQLTLQDLQKMGPDQLDQVAWNFGGSYAYSLGYRDAEGNHGPRFDAGLPNSLRPILADRPPREIVLGDLRNSPNHGGRGQNVLFMDGHCEFCSQRLIPSPVGGLDDIYLNQDNKVQAGRGPWDAVLGDSQARP
jgi:prepilin-type processing-associated H-X9-DG protein